jgi:hypothetical protein
VADTAEINPQENLLWGAAGVDIQRLLLCSRTGFALQIAVWTRFPALQLCNC